MNLTYLEIDHQRSVYHDVVETDGKGFRDRLALSWLYHDHALEGEVVGAEDLDRALQGLPARNYCDGVLLHSLRAMRECIDYIHESAQRGDELSLEWLRDVHKRICPDDYDAAGQYRKRDTSPGVYHLDVAAANSISYHFHKFIDTYRDELAEMHPVRQAAIAHGEFMRVFPFDERTGVVGRLMLNFLLLKHDFPPAIVHATDRHLYFGALNGHHTDLIPVIADATRSTIAAAQAFQDRAGHRVQRQRAAL